MIAIIRAQNSIVGMSPMSKNSISDVPIPPIYKFSIVVVLLSFEVLESF